MSDSLPNISIGDFAESLLNSDSVAPLHESQALPTPNVPGSNNQIDISNVEVPDDFMTELFGGKETKAYLDSILEGAGPQQSLPRPKGVPVKEKGVSQTERLSELLEQLTAVLSETKQLLSEMSVGAAVSTGATTVGQGMGSPGRKRRNTKRRSVAETVAAVLEEMQANGVRDERI